MNNETENTKSTTPPPYVWARGYLIQLNNYEFWSANGATDPCNANFFTNRDEAKAAMYEVRSNEDAYFDQRNGFPRIVKVEQKFEFVAIMK